MLILTGKLPLVFLFIFLYLVNTITLAQSDFTSYFCENAANYTTNSPYERNLNTTLATLPNTNSGFGFFNSSTDQGSDTVHSVALCRGDANLDVCRSCLIDSIVKLRQVCPIQKEAVGYYDNCMLHYSNQTILRSTQIKFNQTMVYRQISSDDRFNGYLKPLLKNLTAEASTGGSLLKFATGNTHGPAAGLINIYALVQCTPDLTQQQCNECLRGAISHFLSQYNGNIGGRNLLPMCNFRYEATQFYNENAPAIPPPSSAESMDIGTAESLQYSFSLAKAATNDFAEDNKLGQGGFGAVYKGKLEDGQEIAVKRLAKDSGQGDIEFKNEVLLVAKLQHRNLVRLLGFSIERSERLLIYEFLPNASLDRFIFDPSKHRPTMASVVRMLDSFSITLQVPSHPAFFMHSSSNPETPLLRDYTSSTGSSGPGRYKLSKSRSSQVSVNDVSLSEVVPR
ncbi:receptor-like protein kinase [Artemisia annua]|uniref:Receptor-like protein kinase n=1 Tax=Artemisia annua TaxID=35608 RepID=A0A2U1QCX7_ARTAN|nr:receptor-like protein kinase [Artemisia annua]